MQKRIIMTIEEKKERFPQEYIDMLEMYKQLRVQRGIKRKTVARLVEMKERTYYAKETYGMAVSLVDMLKFMKAIGFELSATSRDVFSVTRKQKKIRFDF